MQKSKIEWCDVSWNPVRGCSRVSPGCGHCYAEAIAARFSGSGKYHKYSDGTLEGSGIMQPFFGFAEMRNGKPHWTGKVELIQHKLTEPLSWKQPRIIFVNSMSDLFHESLSDEVRGKIFAPMVLCPQHQFLVLTKREKVMQRYMGDDETPGDIADFAYEMWCKHRAPGEKGNLLYWVQNGKPFFDLKQWPLPNVWLGISAERQKELDERWPYLAKTPAAVRFVSYEPALAPFDLTKLKGTPDWVIAGAESGLGARPAHPQWFRDVLNQCRAAEIPFFMKQICDSRGRKIPFEKIPADLQVRENPQ